MRILSVYAKNVCTGNLIWRSASTRNVFRNSRAGSVEEIKLIKLRFDNPKQFVLAFIIAILAGSYFSYATINSVVISNSGTISSLAVITAKSGSPADIQSAVNQVAGIGHGLGTVIVPAGIWNWTTQTVTVPAGVNIIGTGLAGNDGHPNYVDYTPQTIINYTVASSTTVINTMFVIEGMPGDTANTYAPTRISGIEFAVTAPSTGTVENTRAQGSGDCPIVIEQVYNFRVDHCTFINWGTSVFANAGDSGNYTSTCYGVVDHCTFSCPYKMNNPGGTDWLWGYGVYAQGNAWHTSTYTTGWTLPISDFYGYYGPRPSYTIVYTEDCHFTYMRHCTDTMEGGYSCSRFNLEQYPACAYEVGMTDGHGNQYGGWLAGGRGMEVYNNTFVADTSAQLAAYSWWDGNNLGVQLRGGAGLIYNNKFIGNGHTGETAGLVYLSMGDDTGRYYWNCGMDVNQTYIWNNSVTGGGSVVSADSPITLNQNYFLTSPSQAPAGYKFTYTTYAYPIVAG